jgi:hypothetical protein
VTDQEEPLLGIAQGDPGLARLLRDSLERLRDGAAGPILQEMARDVLGGNLDLRQAVTLDQYGQALQQHVRQYVEWSEHADPDQLRALAEQARTKADHVRETDTA